MAELIMRVKQGEELNIGFSIKAGDSLMDLTGYNVRFQVKEVPLARTKSLINKLITTTSDMNDIGRITYPDQGQVVVHLNKHDTLMPPGDYRLIIKLEGENYIDIISSKCENKAIYRVCEQ